MRTSKIPNIKKYKKWINLLTLQREVNSNGLAMLGNFNCPA
ncbi:hypothetical protein [Acinetobacter shaoyimingii]|nr:hypothetical protein [Acinetobacter shaoyimingii]